MSMLEVTHFRETAFVLSMCFFRKGFIYFIVIVADVNKYLLVLLNSCCNWIKSNSFKRCTAQFL